MTEREQALTIIIKEMIAAITELTRADDARIARTPDWQERLQDAWATIIIKQADAIRLTRRAD